MSNSLKNGSKKVKVDGGNSAAIKGSEFSRCNGDEPGTAGGVKSSTNMKEATWILYSFDVKIEGKNACRLSDKMMMNHGNTACLGGHVTKPVGLSPEDDKLADECMELHKEYDETKEELANSKDTNYRDLQQKVYNNKASTAQHKAFGDLVWERYELINRLVEQKQEYVDMDCDKFAWVIDGKPNTKTAAQRKADHEGAISQLRNSFAKFESMMTKGWK